MIESSTGSCSIGQDSKVCIDVEAVNSNKLGSEFGPMKARLWRLQRLSAYHVLLSGLSKSPSLLPASIKEGNTNHS